jgi:hypothetical protein
LTHDIDQVSRRATLNWYQNELNRLWRGERKKIPGKLVRGARALLGRRSPFWTFDRIKSEESKRGVRSTFFFIPFKEGSAQHDYALTESSKVQEVARDLVNGSWEVGLHTTGDDRLCEEVEAMTSLGLPPSSLRYHFLDFRIPESWRTITKEGIGVDCSLGHNEQAGFRAGTCHPFTLFDAHAGEELPVLELPLAIMDSTFYWYQKKSPSEIVQVTDKIMDVVEKRGGVLVVLWHNNYFDASFYREWEGLYGHILGEARRRGAFFGTAEEVSDFWVRRRSELGDKDTGKEGCREEEA